MKLSSIISGVTDTILRLPELKQFKPCDFDSAEITRISKKIFEKKKILSILYKEYCKPCVESIKDLSGNCHILELGSGISPLKTHIPNIITSEIIHLDWTDIACSAHNLPFKTNSLDRIFLLFVFHHLDHVTSFLDEARRCLKNGGEIVIIDPSITWFSKFYYRFHVDKMDLTAKDWDFNKQGRLTESNIALLWIVLFRDSKKFKNLYPEFSIKKIEYNTFLTFLLSGGLRIRQLLPTLVLKFLFFLENFFIRRITKEISVTMSITLQKTLQ